MAERVMDRQAQGYERKLQQIFVAVGVLPILLAIAIVLFWLMSDRFLSGANIANVLRQSSYLTIVALGQMVVMVTAGFDLSVGSTLAVTSVTSALAMSGIAVGYPESPWLAIGGGILAGFACGLAVGICQRLGRRAAQRVALHHDARHGVGRILRRALSHRRHAGARHSRTSSPTPSAAARSSA